MFNNGKKTQPNNGNTPRQVQVVERVKLPEPHEHDREFYGGHVEYERPAAYTSLTMMTQITMK